MRLFLSSNLKDLLLSTGRIQGNSSIQNAQSHPSSGFEDLLRDVTLIQEPPYICVFRSRSFNTDQMLGLDFQQRPVAAGLKSSRGDIQVLSLSDHVLIWQ